MLFHAIPGHYVLDENGEARHEPDPIAWARWRAEAERVDARRVALTEFPGGTVSTVFLGTDHDYTGLGPPVLWETMVFRDGQDAGDEQWRYTSRAEAEAGHAAVIARVLAELPKT